MSLRSTIVAFWGVLLFAAFAQNAESYEVLTALTSGCHEEITATAYLKNPIFNGLDIELPHDSDGWRALYKTLVDDTWSTDPLSITQQWVLISLVLGARAPDTGGFTVYNLDWLRKLHIGATNAGQYIHFTRGHNDDFEEGNQNVVNGGCQIILTGMERVRALITGPKSSWEMTTMATLDFYGSIDVPVFAPAYVLGVAAHTFADSFSHTVRTEQSDFSRIAMVANYIDAISRDYDEERDGIAHSEFTDDCHHEELQPIQDALARGMADLILLAISDDNARDEPFCDKWLTLETGCTVQNQACDNPTWLGYARRQPTVPYLGCTAIERQPVMNGSLFGTLINLFLTGWTVSSSWYNML